MAGRWVGCSARMILWMTMIFGLGGLAFAVDPNDRVIKPQINVQDSDDITSPDSKVWVLDFVVSKDPRLIKVDVPGRGQRVCWYLWYQVINRTKEPRTFFPDFELVARKSPGKSTVHHDEILPKVQEAIRQLEDPSNSLKVKNSVTIAAMPIPPSKPNALRPVTGVAIWDDVDPEANNFQIFVAGLSNGWKATDPIPPSTKPVIRRKTLELDFRRVGDPYLQRSGDIHFVKNEWIYRGSQIELPALPASVAPAQANAPK